MARPLYWCVPASLLVGNVRFRVIGIRKPPHHPPGAIVGRRPYLTFPEFKYGPATKFENAPDSFVSSRIEVELSSPEHRVRLWQRRMAYWAPVPEASMHEYGELVLGERNLRPARDAGRFKAISAQSRSP